MGISAESLLDLLAAARAAGRDAERCFVLLNRTREAVPYHAAVLVRDGKFQHSGATEVDAHGPYGQWLAKLAKQRAGESGGVFGASQVDTALAQEWPSWWPAHALWLPFEPGTTKGGFLLCRDAGWTEAETAWLGQWLALWQLTDRAATGNVPRHFIHWPALGAALRAPWRSMGGSARLGGVLAAVAAVLFVPVQLTVRAPGELVPREPTVLRATVDGMARRLHVEPNQQVKAGQLLAELDDQALASRLQMAWQALATAEAEWRQTGQQALSDPRAKSQLAAAQGRVEEKRTEVDYLEEQVKRTELRAPHDGIVLLDDPGNWAGRTVAAGEPLLRVARADDQEVEAWLAPADAIDLPMGSGLRLFLTSRPADPVKAELRLYGFEAQPRPDGTLGYRLRGRITDGGDQRLGARGTVHVDGGRVPLAYWVLRRPLAALREATGW